MSEGEDKHITMTKGALRGFIAVTIAFVIMGIVIVHDINKNTEAINELRITKANISQLQKSNCAIKTALYKARLETYNKAIVKGESEKQALSQTTNLTTIIIGMDGEEYCPTRRKYLIGKER